MHAVAQAVGAAHAVSLRGDHVGMLDEAATTTRGLRIGLVQQVVPLDQLDAAVDAVVADLLVGGPRAQVEIKQLFAQLAVGPITPEVRELTAQTIARVRGTGEAREGFAAFLGKRAASWIPQ